MVYAQKHTGGICPRECTRSTRYSVSSVTLPNPGIQFPNGSVLSDGFLRMIPSLQQLSQYMYFVQWFQDTKQSDVRYNALYCCKVQNVAKGSDDHRDYNTGENTD